MIFIPYIFFVFAFFILLGYGVIILLALHGFRNKTNALSSSKNHDAYLEVIVAFRNEEKYLPDLLESLNSQIYRNFHVFFIDDHSTDQSASLIRAANSNGLFTIVSNHGVGKKAAIRTGIEATRADYLVFTDADCRVPATWLTSYAKLFEQKADKLIFGWVTYRANSTLQRIFALEFLSLTGVGMGLAGAGKPIYMNGANYAISRNILQIIPVCSGESYASGDDVFLLHAVEKYLGKRFITACPDVKMAVTTHSPSGVWSFLKQRIRWGSKARSYTNSRALGVAIIVFSLSLMQIAALVLVEWWYFAALLWGAKLIIDVLALWQFQKKSGGSKLLAVMPLLFPVYPFYLLVASVGGLFADKQHWLK